MTSARSDLYSAMSSSTRAVHNAGYINQSTMGYVTIATTGNATDFGNYTSSRYAVFGLSNSVTGIIGGGTSGQVMNKITIATTGNATTAGSQGGSANAIGGASDCHGGLG